MLRGIGEKVGIAVGSAILLGVLALIWNLATNGGLVSALGGITKDEFVAYKKALDEAGEPDFTTAIPSAAVMAFDTPSRCPDGWTPFAESQGRALIGASFGIPDNLERSIKLTARKYRAHGGLEEVKLTESQMPTHDHAGTHATILDGATKPPYRRIVAGQNAIWGGEWRSNQKLVHTGKSGGSAAHPNMTPYLALYFCRKD